MVLRPRLAAALAAILCCLSGVVGRAEDQLSDEQAVQAGKDALSGLGAPPWYDRGHDDVRRLRIAPRDAADSQNRGSSWTNDSTVSTPARMPRLSLFGSALQWIGFTALALLLGLLAYLVATAFLKEETSESAALKKIVQMARDADRVEALPFKVRSKEGDLLAEARRLYEAEQFSEAIIYFFSYQLVQLDKQHLIRLAKGKTNRQYLRELRQRPALRTILELTMIAFEDAFFGHKTLSRERFEQSWQRLDEFHGELERLERAVA